MNPCFTPFSQSTNFTNIVTEKHVNNNLNVVINNLEDFYSSVVEKDRVNRNRFVIEKYNLGLTQLHSNDFKKRDFSPQIIPLTNSDRANITGFITLEEPVVIYSHINLPNTSILMKAHLNMIAFNYWNILKKNSNIITTEVNIDKDIVSIEEDYLKEINAFLFKEQVKFDDRDDNTYKLFLERIIPKTRTLFELVKNI